MSKYEREFLMRHGEIGLLPLLPLLESWERSRGIKHQSPILHEDRWMVFLQSGASNTPMAVAA